MNLLQKRYKSDFKGKSPAYFDQSKNPNFDNKQINYLKKLSIIKGGKTVRICLHKNKQKKLHNMIIFLTKKSNNKVHKHKNQDETYQIISGKMKINIYTNKKKYLRSFVLEPSKKIILRINSNTFHSTIPLTKFVVFHESRIGQN